MSEPVEDTDKVVPAVQWSILTDRSGCQMGHQVVNFVEADKAFCQHVWWDVPELVDGDDVDDLHVRVTGPVASDLRVDDMVLHRGLSQVGVRDNDEGSLVPELSDSTEPQTLEEDGFASACRDLEEDVFADKLDLDLLKQHEDCQLVRVQGQWNFPFLQHSLADVSAWTIGFASEDVLQELDVVFVVSDVPQASCETIRDKLVGMLARHLVHAGVVVAKEVCEIGQCLEVGRLKLVRGFELVRPIYLGVHFVKVCLETVERSPIAFDNLSHDLEMGLVFHQCLDLEEPLRVMVEVSDVL